MAQNFDLIQGGMQSTRDLKRKFRKVKRFESVQITSEIPSNLKFTFNTIANEVDAEQMSQLDYISLNKELGNVRFTEKGLGMHKYRSNY